MSKLQGQVTKSIKQYNNRLKKGNAPVLLYGMSKFLLNEKSLFDLI